MAQRYDYLILTLERGRLPDFAKAARGVPGVIGLFQGQLGFASNEAVVLLRDAPDAIAALRAAPGVAGVSAEDLTPTVRPAGGKQLKRGGIYVHRWFVVDEGRTEDFVALSNKAWENFEGSYDTEIFGLFTAPPAQDGAGRLLLLTWYASHGVWEQSRDQTRDPAGLFVRRHALTRSTIGKSSVTLSLES
ncbi:MAG TPA: hypothetical protein VG387_18505 [Rhizomicrobium sp.]|jgi:hypothetical protein|nr:hypothetical protein [Rhizomicrobium sp.]